MSDVLRLSPRKLYAAVNYERGDESWRSLARRLGCQPSTFSRMKRGRLPDANTLFACLNLMRRLSGPRDYALKNPRRPR